MLILIILLAAVTNAATNIAPALHRAMFYCRGGAKRCLEGVQIAPRCNLLGVDKIAFGHGVKSSGYSTISRPHPVLK